MRNVHRWAGWGLAAAIVLLVAAPWPIPRPEVLIDRFDEALLTIDADGASARPGHVDLSPQAVVLRAGPKSEPAVHLLTAEVPFEATFTASVEERRGDAFPLQVWLWNARTNVGLVVWYAPDGSVYAGLRAGGRWSRVRRLGEHRVGETAVWRVAREPRRLRVWIAGAEGSMQVDVDPAALPGLFTDRTVSLSISANGAGGEAVATLRNPRLVIDRQDRYATTVAGPWYRPAVALAALLASVWLAVSGSRNRRWPLPTRRTLSARVLAPATAVIAAGILLGAALSHLPAHPLDTRVRSIWMHIARGEGVSEMVGRSMLATEGGAHGGQPYASVVFPYPPLLMYLYGAAGAAAPGPVAERTVRVAMVMAAGAVAALLYSMLSRAGVPRRSAGLAAAAILFNPVVLFDSAVWGQTDAVVAGFLLLSVGGVIVSSPATILIGAGLAVLTKQTALLFLPMLLVLGAGRLGIRAMIAALPKAVACLFIALTPLLLMGIHPAVIYRPLLTKVLDFGTVAHMEIANAVASQGAFTLWTTLAGFEGASGLQRIAYPDYLPTGMGFSYFMLSRAVFVLFAVAMGVAGYRRARGSAGSVFLVMAAYGAGVTLLLTRTSPWSLLLTLPFVAAALPWLPRLPGTALFAAMSATTFVSMGGLLVLAAAWDPGVAAVFHPGRSWLSAVMLKALTTDAGVTAGGVANLAVLFGLLAFCARPLALRPSRS